MQYTSTISWSRNDRAFTAKEYDRTHDIQFAGGVSIQGSSAPEYSGNAKLPNPEELFTASISSCFMLTFLYLATTKNLVIDEYRATAVGTLAKNSEGKMAMTEVVIKPSLTFQGGIQPDAALLDDLFKKAHDNCFISCSVKTKVSVQYAAVHA